MFLFSFWLFKQFVFLFFNWAETFTNQKNPVCISYVQKFMPIIYRLLVNSVVRNIYADEILHWCQQHSSGIAIHSLTASQQPQSHLNSLYCTFRTNQTKNKVLYIAFIHASQRRDLPHTCKKNLLAQFHAFLQSFLFLFCYHYHPSSFLRIPTYAYVRLLFLQYHHRTTTVIIASHHRNFFFSWEVTIHKYSSLYIYFKCNADLLLQNVYPSNQKHTTTAPTKPPTLTLALLS